MQLLKLGRRERALAWFALLCIWANWAVLWEIDAVAWVAFPLSMGVAVGASVSMARYHRSAAVFFPLFTAVAALRFWIPALLHGLGYRYDNPLLRALENGGTSQALALVLLSQSTVLLGYLLWRFPRAGRAGAQRWGFSPLVTVLAFVAGLIGLNALLSRGVGAGYVSQFLDQGAFRGQSFQTASGSGRFQVLAGSVLPVASVLLSVYLLQRGRRLVAFAPSLVATVALALFGGRGNSLLPILATGCVYWVLRGRGQPLSLRRRITAIGAGAAAVVLLVLFSFWIVQLRGGTGADRLLGITNTRAVSDYVTYALWLDWGHLYPVAMAQSVESFPINKSGLFNVFNPFGVLTPLGFEAESAGEQLTRATGFARERDWGVAASLPGSLYLYGGLLWVAVGSIFFGAVMRLSEQLLLGRSVYVKSAGALSIVAGIIGVFVGEPSNLAFMSGALLTIGILATLSAVWIGISGGGAMKKTEAGRLVARSVG